MTDTTSMARAGPSGYDLPRLNVSERNEGPSTWAIELRGELDLLTGPTLKQYMEEAYNHSNGDGGRPRRVVYLLPELEFMDARGLHYLLTAVNGHAETITIREPSSRVRRLLELVGLDSMIEEPTNR